MAIVRTYLGDVLLVANAKKQTEDDKMKTYSGESIKQILDDIAYEEGIDPSLIHYNIQEK